jgi:2-oxoglutarate ferredoxin oxidoreductase subunit beta
MRAKEEFHLSMPNWCRGCGLFGIFEAVKRAATSENIDPEQTVMVTGIGCHGRMNNSFRAYGFHGSHGRVLPVATGVKLCHPGLVVIGVSGDGDAYSIGQGHFIHAVRRNVGIIYLVSDNRVYGLTQGQVSPTTEIGFVSISTPFGSKEFPIDGPTLALAAGGTFIARGFSGDVPHLAGLIGQAFRHRGFALIDVLSPCVIHNKVNTYHWFRSRIVNLDAEPAYRSGDKIDAWRRLQDPDKIPVGLIYKDPHKPAFEDQVVPDRSRPFARQALSVDIPALEKIMEKFR